MAGASLAVIYAASAGKVCLHAASDVLDRRVQFLHLTHVVGDQGLGFNLEALANTIDFPEGWRQRLITEG